MNINSQDIRDFYNSVDNPFDIPITENGLWEYPNQEVIVPTNGSITMKGVGYPVIGKSLETGEEKIMMPGEEYFFKNTKNVHETPKYQDGGIIDRETQVLKNTVNDDNDDLFYAQKGGSIDNENVKNFYNDMLNAPWYKERLNENGYMDSDNVISKRLKNINRIDFSVNNSVNTGYSQYKNLPSFLSNPNVTLNTNESDYLNTPYNDSISHEYGHGETKGYDLSAFEKSLIEDSYIGNDNDKQVNYLKSPYETKSDINAIRYHLYNMGKYNPKTGEYDTDSKLFEPSLLNNDLENTIIKRMKDAYGDDNLKKLMNTVADTNLKDKGYNA